MFRIFEQKVITFELQQSSHDASRHNDVIWAVAEDASREEFAFVEFDAEMVEN